MADANNEYLFQETNEVPEHDDADEEDAEDDAAEQVEADVPAPTDIDANDESEAQDDEAKPQIQIKTVEDDEEEEVGDEPPRDLSTPPCGSLPSNVCLRLARESLSPLISPLMGALRFSAIEEEVQFEPDENAVAEDPIPDDVMLQLVRALAHNVRDPQSAQHQIMSQVQGHAADITSQVQSQLQNLGKLGMNVTVHKKSPKSLPQQPKSPSQHPSLPGSSQTKLPQIPNQSGQQQQKPKPSFQLKKTNWSSKSFTSRLD